MSLQTRLEALASAVGADIKADRATMGSLASLTTTAKTSLVAAINELKASSGSGGAYPWTEQILTASYTNSTVTASDVFAGFTPVAQQRTLIDVLLLVSSAAATTGVQTAIIGSAAQLREGAVKIVSASAAGTDLITHTTINTFQTAVAGLTTPNLLSIQAILNWGATAPASPVKVQAKSEVAGSAITIYPGSSMRWRTI